jgi:DNA polymerase elongation subunit (family B)
MMFYSSWTHTHNEMVGHAHRLLGECDAALHYNGKRFDIPYLNKEFLIEGLGPPVPYANIDLYAVVKKRFRFPSNKLDYVSQEMGFGGKVHHEGHELWVKVLAGDEDAQRRMQEYNEQDVVLLEQMYRQLRPWIPSHPNVALIDGEGSCVVCGSMKLVERESAYTAMSKYKQFQCLKCGSWQRETARQGATTMRGLTW